MDDASTIDKTGPLVLFDGVCNLCSFSARFLARHDRTGRLRFASVQSPVGQRVLLAHGLPTDHYDSFVFLRDGHVFLRSEAAFALLPYLGRGWQALRLLRVLPRPVADWIYDRIARNRYRLFGRRDTCLVPDPSLAARFVE